VPDVTLSVDSGIYDPLKGGTQTVRIGGDPSVIVVIEMQGDATVATLDRGGTPCSEGGVCWGTGDLVIILDRDIGL
jgi:hypothetical protein